MKPFGKFLTTSLMLSLLTCVTLAQEAKPEKNKDKEKAKETVEYVGKGDGVETCPVSGNPVKPEFKGEALGREFHACCESCVAMVKKNPEAYLKPLPKKKSSVSEQKRRR